MKKIFFSASTYSVPDLLENYISIIKEIKKNKAEVMLDWTKDWKTIAKEYNKSGIKNIKENDIFNIIDRKKYYQEHIKAIQGCDAIIAEVTKPTISVGYQLFYAISHKKPVLALYTGDKSSDLDTIKSIIDTDSPLIMFKKYNKKSLGSTIKSFIIKRENELKKFNFIISKDIDIYLDWLKSKQPSKSKSELLRDKIKNEIIINDNDFQLFLKSH